MILQLTDFAVGVLSVNPAPILDVFKIGSGFNYVPQPTDIDIHGSLLFQGLISQPLIQNANVVKYTVSMDSSIGDFDWGEVAFFYQGQLFALATGNTLQTKLKNGTTPGNIVRLDAFLTVVGNNYAMIVDQADSTSSFQMANLSTVDQLPPVNATDPNAYIISAAAANQSSFLAYTDRVGLWNFDAYQYAALNRATVTAADALSVTIALADFSPNMAPSFFGETILQFTTGANYSIVRYIQTSVQSGSSVVLGFQTPMAIVPKPGDKVQVLSRVANSAELQIPIATASTLGGIKIGAGLIVAADGTCSVDAGSLGAVTQVNGKTGVVQLTGPDIPGLGAVAYSNNYADLSGIPAPYQLPLMSLSLRGGAKLPTSGNLILTGTGGEELDLSFPPVKRVNGVAPDGSGNVSLASTVVGLVNPTAVLAGADLDQLNTTGLFTISSGVISTLTNAPTASGAATLEVVPNNITGSGDSVQRFTNGTQMYWRKSTGASWTPWVQVATNQIATSAQLGVIRVGNSMEIDAPTGILNPKIATAAAAGIVRPGSGLAVDGNGVLTVVFPKATTTSLGVMQVGSGLAVDANGVVSVNGNDLPKATTTVFGVVKVGTGLAINGVTSALEVNGATLPKATTTSLGVVQIGSGITVDPAGVIAWDATQLPVASATVLGAIKVGAGLTMTGQVLSANARTVNGVTPDAGGNIVLPPVADPNKLNVVNGVAQGIRLKFIDVGTITSGGAVTISQTDANAFAMTFTGGASAWTITGWPGVDYAELQLEIINGGTATHSFPAGLKWVNPDGTFTNSLSTYMTNQRGTTNFQTAGTDFVCMWSRDGGSNIYAKVL